MPALPDKRFQWMPRARTLAPAFAEAELVLECRQIFRIRGTATSPGSD